MGVMSTVKKRTAESVNSSENKSQLCVLAVDDAEAILRVIRLCLTMAGYRVVTATRGEEALKLITSEKPNIMLLDVFMPGMGGLELLTRLRAISDLPVICVSAHISSTAEALKLGADDFLSKPFRPAELVKKIEAFI
jgi:DNA-binding response OmpR family regulator